MPPLSMGSEPGLHINKEKYQRPHSERLLQRGQILLPYKKHYTDQFTVAQQNFFFEHSETSRSRWDQPLAQWALEVKNLMQTHVLCQQVDVTGAGIVVSDLLVSQLLQG